MPTVQQKGAARTCYNRLYNTEGLKAIHNFDFVSGLLLSVSWQLHCALARRPRCASALGPPRVGFRAGGVCSRHDGCQWDPWLSRPFAPPYLPDAALLVARYPFAPQVQILLAPISITALLLFGIRLDADAQSTEYLGGGHINSLSTSRTSGWARHAEAWEAWERGGKRGHGQGKSLLAFWRHHHLCFFPRQWCTYQNFLCSFG